MDVSAITNELKPADFDPSTGAPGKNDPAKIAKVSRQFESILLRQILGESMKPLLNSGPSGQVYGYMMTDALAEKISDAGGLGLAHVLQAQLTKSLK